MQDKAGIPPLSLHVHSAAVLSTADAASVEDRLRPVADVERRAREDTDAETGARKSNE
jgi:hypothetical protein